VEETRVKLVREEDASGVVKDVFEEMEQVRGKGRISNLFRGYAIAPEILKANWNRMKALMGGGRLSKKLKEAVMVALAELNQCTY
jgi:hypothetical protein